MTIECVTLASSHLFPGNAIAGQHELRHKTIIQRQSWEVPQFENMEYDDYDNPATIYLVWRDENLITRGVARLYPTDRPFMLGEKFPHMAEKPIPTGERVLEGSRFCIDNTLPAEIRARISKELILAYMEYCIIKGIDQIVGIMYPAYWKTLFIRNGWNPTWLGEPIQTPDGKRSRAGYVDVSLEAYQHLKETVKINHSILNFGQAYVNSLSIAA